MRADQTFAYVPSKSAPKMPKNLLDDLSGMSGNLRRPHLNPDIQKEAQKSDKNLPARYIYYTKSSFESLENSTLKILAKSEKC